MKKNIIKVALAALLAVAALGLFACTGNGNGEGNGGNGGNGGGITPGKPGAPADTMARFDYVETYGDTVYVSSRGNAMIFFQANGTAELYRWYTPDTEYAPISNSFAHYNGVLYYVDVHRHTDASSALVSLFAQDLATGKVTVIADDVDADVAPVILNDVLYYVTVDPEGMTFYDFTTESGHKAKDFDMTKASYVLVALDLNTGEKKTTVVEGSMGWLRIVGATQDTLFLGTYTENYVAQVVVQMSADLVEGDSLIVENANVMGVDPAGNLIIQGYDGKYSYLKIFDKKGNIKMEALCNGNSMLSQNRYLVYEDLSGVVTVLDTTNLQELLVAMPKDNPAKYSSYLFYQPLTNTVYFLGSHTGQPGTYSEYGATAVSIFGMDAEGQCRRVIKDVVWRNQEDWAKASAYVLQWSELEFYTYEQLDTLSNEELFYGRNEIFWAHGFNFNTESVDDPDLQAFFSNKTWPREQVNSDFTAAELENLAIIHQIETDRKSPYVDRGYMVFPSREA